MCPLLPQRWGEIFYFYFLPLLFTFTFYFYFYLLLLCGSADVSTAAPKVGRDLLLLLFTLTFYFYILLLLLPFAVVWQRRCVHCCPKGGARSFTFTFYPYFLLLHFTFTFTFCCCVAAPMCPLLPQRWDEIFYFYFLPLLFT